MDNKIKTQKEILDVIEGLRKEGKKIITYNGSFDILHIGHMRAIKEAKKQGDVLIIILNSDKSIKLYKGPNHPVNKENVRAEMMAGIEGVNYVVLFDDINPKEILAKIKPDVHCNGCDWGRDCVERDIVEKNGGEIYILPWQEGFSTSKIVKKISNVADVKAVFLDRDGTININNPEYLHKIKDFKFVPGAISALKKLSKTGYKIIIVTNQSGIARGYYSKRDLEILHKWMLGELKKNGARIDKIYYCPHGPDDSCSCRKPKIGMFIKAVKDFDINLSKSWFVGDDKRDVIAGRDANIKTIKIGDRMPAELKLEPNFYAQNLLKAVEIILKTNNE